MESQLQPSNSNILYDPQQHLESQFLEDEMIETQSVSTVGGGAEKIISNYKTDLDPTLFATQKMYDILSNISKLIDDAANVVL